MEEVVLAMIVMGQVDEVAWVADSLEAKVKEEVVKGKAAEEEAVPMTRVAPEVDRVDEELEEGNTVQKIWRVTQMDSVVREGEEVEKVDSVLMVNGMKETVKEDSAEDMEEEVERMVMMMIVVVVVVEKTAVDKAEVEEEEEAL